MCRLVRGPSGGQPRRQSRGQPRILARGSSRSLSHTFACGRGCLSEVTGSCMCDGGSCALAPCTPRSIRHGGGVICRHRRPWDHTNRVEQLPWASTVHSPPMPCQRSKCERRWRTRPHDPSLPSRLDPTLVVVHIDVGCYLQGLCDHALFARLVELSAHFGVWCRLFCRRCSLVRLVCPGFPGRRGWVRMLRADRARPGSTDGLWLSTAWGVQRRWLERLADPSARAWLRLGASGSPTLHSHPLGSGRHRFPWSHCLRLDRLKLQPATHQPHSQPTPATITTGNEM
jgi:hypothetical protein